MIENIISNENIIEREKNIFEKIILVVCMLSFIYIFNIFSKIGSEKLHYFLLEVLILYYPC